MQATRRSLRKSFIFLTLWTLLVLCQAGDILDLINQYRAITGAERLITLPPPLEAQSQMQLLEQLTERRNEVASSAVETGVELLLLGGLCWVFFQVRKQATSDAVDRLTAS